MQTDVAVTSPEISRSRPADSHDWRSFIIPVLVLAAAYYTAFDWMVRAWTLQGSNYSHGFWVPLVVGYFLWDKRATLSAVPKRGHARGLWYIGAAMALHLAGLILDIHVFSGLSLFPLFWGLALYYFGPYVLKEVFYPSLFMIFMIPLPLIQAVVSIKLQTISAIAASAVLTLLGFPVLREGTMMALPSFQLFVEAPCSGLNTIFSLIFVGSVVAYLARGAWWRKAVLLLSAVPIAVLANIFRITMIGLLGEYYGEEVAMGVFHNFSGVIMYSIGLALFLAEAWLLRVKFTSAEGAA